MNYASDGHGPTIDAISRDLALLYERFWGKQPTAVETIWRGDVITVVLRGVLTRGETNLCEVGKFENVRRERQAFAEETEGLLSGLIEGLTGRPVLDVMSQVSPKDEATEVFLLGAAEGLASRRRRRGHQGVTRSV